MTSALLKDPTTDSRQVNQLIAPTQGAIERVWQFIQQQFKGEVFLTPVELPERLNLVLQEITPEQIRSLFSYNFIFEALFYGASY